MSFPWVVIVYNSGYSLWQLQASNRNKILTQCNFSLQAHVLCFQHNLTTACKPCFFVETFRCCVRKFFMFFAQIKQRWSSCKRIISTRLKSSEHVDCVGEFILVAVKSENRNVFVSLIYNGMINLKWLSQTLKIDWVICHKTCHVDVLHWSILRLQQTLGQFSVQVLWPYWGRFAWLLTRNKPVVNNILFTNQSIIKK